MIAMANITKRVNKRAASLLDGEAAEVALLVEPKGTFAAGGVVTALVPRLQMRRTAEKAADANRQQGGVAAGFPARAAVVAVTPTRIVAIESNGLTFKRLDFEAPRAEVRLISSEGKGLGRRLTIGFGDGSEVVVDAQRGQPHARFADVLGGPAD
ncbi:MAG: hypothetical protein WBM50_12120 [Acidimicrobiales bacterium]